jgi:plastocyanin domain-containing protein
MEILKSRFSPNQFTLRKGIPVKWVIDGKEMNECNKTIVIPQYKMKIELKEGSQIIEFTPPESGVVPWSCWMGMIPGTFIVIDDVPAPKQNEVQSTGQKFSVIEAYRQRFVQEVRKLWRRLESFYQDVWAGKY